MSPTGGDDEDERAYKTGEYRVPKLPSQMAGVQITATTILAVIGILGGPLSWYVSTQVGEDRRIRLEERVTGLEIDRLDRAKESRATELRIQRYEDNNARIFEAIGELKTDVKDIKSTMVRRTPRRDE